MSPYKLSPARLFAVVGFALSCFGILLYLWSVFGGPVPMRPTGYRITFAIPEAEILTDNAHVRISGVNVGKVITTSKVGKDVNRKDVLIELDSRYAPIGRDVKAMIRRKSIGGEMYVELTPGSPEAPKVPDGGRVSHANVTESVELDEVFMALDPRTRRALQHWFQQQSLSIEGNGSALSDALGNLAGFETESTELLKLLNSQKGAVREAVSGTKEVFAALGQRRDALQGVITNGERATRAIAIRDDEFADVWRALPAFEMESRRLLATADRFAAKADPVVTQFRSAWRELAPLVDDAEPFAQDLAAMARGLDAAEKASRKGLPAATELIEKTAPFIAEFSPFLTQFEPLVGHLGDHRDTITAFIGNITATTQASAPGITAGDAPIHYARVQTRLAPDTLGSPGAKRWPWNRANPYGAPRTGMTKDRPIPSFDARHCTEATAIELSGVDALDPSLVRRIKRWALNDGQLQGPPCVLQDGPAAGFTRLGPKDR